MPTFFKKKLLFFLITQVLSGLIFYSFVFKAVETKADTPSTSVSVVISVCGNNLVEGSEQCDGSDLGTASCVSLGYSGGTLGCNVACEHQTSSCIATVPTASTTPTVDFSNGGSFTLTNPDNTTVVFAFPANFYTEDIKFQANSYANNFFASDKPAVSGKSFIGKTYDFSLTASSTESQVITTSAAVTFTIGYLDSDISGIDENTLAPYRWGASDTSWQLIPGATIDTADNKVTFSTTHFSAFALFGSSSSGGGGGGGGGAPPPTATKVILQGKAYPSAKITVLIDGAVGTLINADSQANFKAEITTITAGVYTFSLWAEDKAGRKSITFSFTTTVTKDMTTTVSNIFLPPTIDLEKVNIAKGEDLNIFGQTAPKSQITISVESPHEIIKKVTAVETGDWQHSLDTSLLEEGTHTTRAKAETPEGLLSSYSKVLAFYVGKYGTAQVCPGADFNKDKKVNLTDFSILLYWWGKNNTCIDQNQDGIVNLPDFSILLYWWTG